MRYSIGIIRYIRYLCVNNHRFFKINKVKIQTYQKSFIWPWQHNFWLSIALILLL